MSDSHLAGIPRPSSCTSREWSATRERDLPHSLHNYLPKSPEGFSLSIIPVCVLSLAQPSIQPRHRPSLAPPPTVLWPRSHPQCVDWFPAYTLPPRTGVPQGPSVGIWTASLCCDKETSQSHSHATTGVYAESPVYSICHSPPLCPRQSHTPGIAWLNFMNDPTAIA